MRCPKCHNANLTDKRDYYSSPVPLVGPVPGCFVCGYSDFLYSIKTPVPRKRDKPHKFQSEATREAQLRGCSKGGKTSGWWDAL